MTPFPKTELFLSAVLFSCVASVSFWTLFFKISNTPTENIASGRQLSDLPLTCAPGENLTTGTRTKDCCLDDKCFHINLEPHF